MANLNESKVQQILTALKKINYGSVLITIHEGEITQLDSTEKNRFVKPKPVKHS
ncbi:YezD family protein [Metabacillus idriensis]|uniref:YezD family protein n=1 Tax=Metabacillus idriensis TaxID=324768 RepID=UPI0028131A91|nr:YezD family protein [Metabacillus idriensis]MDR0136745.1 YezD family protein [Metabacillus idriensis]